MKKLFLSMSLMLAALTLTNCTKDAAEDQAVVAGGKGFSFTANIDGVGDTKATLEGVKTVWEAGDQIGFGGIKETDTYTTARLYGFDYVSGNVFSSEKSTFSAPNQFYAIFPTALESGKYIEVYTANYKDDAAKVNTTGSYIAVSGQSMKQVGTSAAHVPAYSPMYWMSNGAISPNGLAVQFHHTTSLMKFTVVNAEDAKITVKGVRLSVPADTKISGTYYINLETGELIPSGANYVYNSASVAVENAPALAKGESFDVYMPVAPFALAANDAVSVVITTTDNAVCTVEKTMAAAIKFEAGKINTATVNFVKDAVADAPMTVSELAKALEAGTTSFAGKKVSGFVSALAATAADNFSQGTVILTDNSGNEYSAVKFFNNPKTESNGIYTTPELAIGDELEIDLTNAVVGEYSGKQITGLTADDVETLSYGIPIVAKEITVDAYLANYKAYNNVYLKLVDVTPTEAGVFTGTIPFTDGTNEVAVYGRPQWTEGQIEIAKVKGTLYGIGQIYTPKDAPEVPQIVPATVADIEAFAAPFTINKESVSFAADGGTEEIKVTLKDGYTLGAVENAAAWLTIIPASDGTILLTAAANTEATAREAKVNIAVMNGAAAYATITIAVSQKAAGAAETLVTDVLTWQVLKLDASSTSYADFSYTSTISDATYVGSAASGKGQYIQLRSNDNKSGIVTTKSGGYVRKIVVNWNSATLDARTLDIYGSDTAFNSSSELYKTTATKLGSINKASQTTLEITGNYPYIGMRSNSSAMYIDSIEITYEK